MDEYKQNFKMGRGPSIHSAHEEHSLPQSVASEVDRGRLDPPNFTAVVQEHESETGLYTLGTRAGTLNTRFSRNQFNLMNQKFLTTADVPEDVTLSVREAARLHSNAGGQGFFKCLCQTACLTKNANASGILSSAIFAVIKIVVARIMTMP